MKFIQSPLRLSLVSFAILFAGILVAMPAQADYNPYWVTFTPDSSSLSVTEGQTLMETFTITTSDTWPTYTYPLYLYPGTAISAGTFVSGDPTDVPMSLDFTSNLGTCGGVDQNGQVATTLGSNDSCTVVLTINTPQDTGEMDGDSGKTNYTAQLNYDAYESSMVGENYSVTSDFSVTVVDPPVSTPEPSTLVLLGAGLLGLVAVGAWGKRHAWMPTRVS